MWVGAWVFFACRFGNGWVSEWVVVVVVKEAEGSFAGGRVRGEVGGCDVRVG